MKTNIMKIFWLLIFSFLIPVTFYAQKTLTGLWTGKMSLTNDSITTRVDQSFEIALTQYKQTVYGYSRRTFLVNDTLYYVLKRVKGKIDGDACEITDGEYISCNFADKIDKKVKVTYRFHLNKNDSTWSLDGNWSTNRVKRTFYAMSGNVTLAEQKNLEVSEIFPHLEEMKLADDVPFYVEAKKAASTRKTIAVVNKKEIPSKTANKKDTPVKKEDTPPKPVENIATQSQPQKQEAIAVNKSTEKRVIPEIKNDKSASVTNDQVAKNTPVRKDPPVKKEQAIQKPTDNPTQISVNKPVEKKEEKKTVVEPKKEEPVISKISPEPSKRQPVIIENKPKAPAAIEVNERKTSAAQEVDFVSDSLQLALYDNGEVDGDTVSVLLNGEVIVAKQGLKTTAVRKTIYIKPDQDNFTLILYAENLGKYPPNTGLLVVYDGEERYQLRFSANLQQNASVVFRRKK